MKVKVTKLYKQPTEEKVIAYLKGQGFPDAEYKEDFLNPFPTCQQQYWKAVYENIDMCDFDRWQYFQKVIGCFLDWEAYRKIDAVFYENYIEVLEMPEK